MQEHSGAWRRFVATCARLPGLVLALALSLSAVSCGFPHPNAPTTSGWLEDIVGRSPDAVFVLRVEQALADPVYGPMLRSRSKSNDVETALRSIRDAELWVVADAPTLAGCSYVFVVRASPSLDALRESSQDWTHAFPRRTTLPTGVVEYLGAVDDKPVVAYRYPSGTWVGAMGRVVPRVRAKVRPTAEEPRPSDYESEALFAAYVGKGMMRFPEMKKNATSDGVESAWLVVSTSTRGDMAGAATYVDDDHAKRAYELSLTLLEAYGAVKDMVLAKCPILGELRLTYERDGRTIGGRVAGVPHVLGVLKDTGCRDGDSSKARATDE